MTALPSLRQYPDAIPDKTTMDRVTFANAVHPYLNWFNDTFVSQMQSWTASMSQLSSDIEVFTADNITTMTNLASDTANNATIASEQAELASKWAESDTEVVTGSYSAKYWANRSQTLGAEQVDLASKWAESDTEVVSGSYSAKYWANMSQTASNYKGDWDSGYNDGDGYALGDAVSYTDGLLYKSKIDGNTSEPSEGTTTNEWLLITSTKIDDTVISTDATWSSKTIADKIRMSQVLTLAGAF